MFIPLLRRDESADQPTSQNASQTGNQTATNNHTTVFYPYHNPDSLIEIHKELDSLWSAVRFIYYSILFFGIIYFGCKILGYLWGRYEEYKRRHAKDNSSISTHDGAEHRENADPFDDQHAIEMTRRTAPPPPPARRSREDWDELRNIDPVPEASGVNGQGVPEPAPVYTVKDEHGRVVGIAC